jgi:uncharacterized membrane protein
MLRRSRHIAAFGGAFLIAMAAQVAGTSKAAADGIVCNQDHVRIWFTYMKQDNNCDGTKWRQFFWWEVAPGTCQTFFTESAANRMYLYYAIAEDGFEWTGPYNEKVDFANNNRPGGMCFDDAQGLACTNAGSDCETVGHSLQAIGSATRWTVTLRGPAPPP